MPPETVPLAIMARASETVARETSVDGSLGSVSTPTTFVSMTNFEAFRSRASTEATVSAFTFRALPSSSAARDDTTGT